MDVSTQIDATNLSSQPTARSVTHASVEKQLLTSVAVNLSHAIGKYAVQCEVQTSLLRQMAGLEAMLRQRAAPLIALVTFYH